jgi:hypothetical protein
MDSIRQILPFLKGAFSMKVAEIKSKAKEMGINVNKMKKEQIIQAIQSKEGNFPCFRTANGSCEQADCLWRTDCLAN